MSSGSTDFSITRDDLIKGALRLCGVLAQGESPTTDQINEASEALNMLVKAWQVDGMPLWAIKTTAVPLTANTASYRIGIGQTVNVSKPLKVLRAWNRDLTSNVDIPLRLLTKQEYDILGNKTSPGNPVQFYYDPQNQYGDLFVYPVPTDLEQTNNQIFIVYQRPFEDFDAATDTPDFPQEWFEALKYGLASRLAGEYQLSLQVRTFLKGEAKEAKENALSFGTEEGSIFFGRDYRNY